MKKIKLLTAATTLIFSLSGNATDLDSLNISERVKQKLLDSVQTGLSIKSYTHQKGAVSYVTVGNGVTCDYRLGSTKIQDAIDSGADEVRIAYNDTYNENFTINDISVIIKGGYANCPAAESDNQTGKTTINGVTDAGNPVIKILGNSQRNTVILDSLVLTNGDGTEFFPGGGISTASADLDLSLNNILIEDNHSQNGGGIAVVGGDTDVIATDTVLLNNSAQNGGGFYCDSDVSSLTMHGMSGVYGNSTTTIGGGSGYGGGVYIINGCTFVTYSGVDQPEAGDYRGIAYNISAYGGGGVYVGDGAIAILYGHEFCFFDICYGDNTNPINLNNNQSSNVGLDGPGGGAMVFGTDATLNIYAGKVSDNKSKISTGGDGGAIYVRDGAIFDTKRLLKNCWSQQTCNYYANNYAGENFGEGGMLYNRASMATIENTVIEGNRAYLGTVLYSASANSLTTIKGSVIFANGDNGSGDFNDNYAFVAEVNAEIDVFHSTIADNNVQGAVFNIHETAGGNSELTASIVHDINSGPLYESNVGPSSVNCSIVHEINSASGSTFSIVDDPEFIDGANHDYHLNAALSPAVDFCFAIDSSYADMDFENRGWDDYLVPDFQGTFDAGADESYANDVIFKNGVEQQN